MPTDAPVRSRPSVQKPVFPFSARQPGRGPNRRAVLALPSLLRARSRAFPDTGVAVELVRSHAICDIHPLSEFNGRAETLTAISGNPMTVDGRRPGSVVVTWVSVAAKTATAHLVDKPIIASNALIPSTGSCRPENTSLYATSDRGKRHGKN